VPYATEKLLGAHEQLGHRTHTSADCPGQHACLLAAKEQCSGLEEVSV
jgi:hypothetical protein